MKKTILIGALATAFIVTGGTGLYMASAEETPSINKISPQMSNMMETGNMMGTGNFDEMEQQMEEIGVDFDEMQQYMEEGNMNFGQMKGIMSKMHPNLGTQELEEMYKSMHGTGGSSESRNFN